MKKLLLIMAVVASAAVYADAQEGGGRRGGGQRGRGMWGGGVGMTVAPLADANKDSEITQKEWSGFVKSLGADDEGNIDSDALKIRLVTHTLDANQNGKLEAADIQAHFDRMDKDSDGALSREEMGRGRGGNRGAGRGRGGRGGGQGGQGGEGGGGFRTLDDDEPKKEEPKQEERQPSMLERMVVPSIIGRADADQNREVSAEEWKTFKAGLGEGTIKDDAIQAWLEPPARPEGEEEGNSRRRRGGRGGVGSTLDRMLGIRDGKAPVSAYEEAFGQMDRNEDGKIDKSELQPRRRTRRA